MRHLSRFLGDRVVLVLFGISVLAMLAAAAWAPVYVWSAEEKGPAMVALFLGLFLGCNGGVIIAGILAAAARQDACERADRAGYLRGLERGRNIGREEAFLMTPDPALAESRPASCEAELEPAAP